MKINEISQAPIHFAVLNLFENRQQYKQMMEVLIKNDIVNSGRAESTINYFRQYLKRNDRIVWAIYWYRLRSIELAMVSAELDEDQERVTLLQKIYQKLAKRSYLTHQTAQDDAFDNWLINEQSIQHLANSIDTIPGVNEIQWDIQKSPITLRNEILTAERRWQEERRQFVEPEENDRIILSYDNGKYGWVLLDRGACRAEGDAMGHCGNVPSVREGDQILSFRSIFETEQKPHLTFILHGNGFLGEMKGRANNKPNEKYHPYIVDLLKQDFIKGISGGGYAPDQNFQLSDLDESLQEELLDIKPLMGGPILAWVRNNKEYTPEIGESLKYTANINFPIFDTSTGKILVEVFDSISEIGDFIESDELSYIGRYDVFGGDQFFEFDYSGDVPTDYADEIYEKLDVESKNKIKQYLVDQNIWDDHDTIERMIDTEDDELRRAFQYSTLDGFRIGSENEMYRDVISWLRNNGFRELNEDEVEKINSELPRYTKKVTSYNETLEMHANNLLQYYHYYNVELDNNIDNYEFIEMLDISKYHAPRYGYDGFDLDVAVEAMEETHLPDAEL